MDNESKCYSIYKNTLLVDIGRDSGKVCLELSRGLIAWSSVVCKERKHKVKAAHFWKAREPPCSSRKK